MTSGVKRWRSESRSDGTYWLTDGTESFRMLSPIIADLLASYLNEAKR